MIIKIILISVNIFSWGYVGLELWKSSLATWLKFATGVAVFVTSLRGIDLIISGKSLIYIYLSTLLGAA